MTIRLFPGPPGISGDAPRLALREQGHYRAAAGHARRVIPGPVGELVHRELRAYAEFGHRFGDDALIQRLAAEVLAIRPDDPQAEAHTAVSGVLSLLDESWGGPPPRDGS
ncbi:hypothetical protein [Pseudonocardia parietis]|uniref:Uncharacterized protein n=1 Tax=Pseudonocardia parietis TaxID=570936 RepID=A0ABS4VXB2_9PSEU|nr:hypothetical protein [Pseudonocardia parietis]MBP2368578.1 hypothetical protein [Pseudonocardia parietis]